MFREEIQGKGQGSASEALLGGGRQIACDNWRPRWSGPDTAVDTWEGGGGAETGRGEYWRGRVECGGGYYGIGGGAML